MTRVHGHLPELSTGRPSSATVARWRLDEPAESPPVETPFFMTCLTCAAAAASSSARGRSGSRRSRACSLPRPTCTSSALRSPAPEVEELARQGGSCSSCARDPQRRPRGRVPGPRGDLRHRARRPVFQVAERGRCSSTSSTSARSELHHPRDRAQRAGLDPRLVARRRAPRSPRGCAPRRGADGESYARARRDARTRSAGWARTRCRPTRIARSSSRRS